MRKKLIQWAFILMTLVPLQVTEKQGFDFGKFIKGNRNSKAGKNRKRVNTPIYVEYKK